MRSARLFLASLPLLLLACGDDASPAFDAAPDAAPDGTADAAEMLFDAATEDAGVDAPDVSPTSPELAIDGHATDVFVEDASIELSGTATHPIGIEGVRVNGVAAESDDGFHTWRIDQSLDWGVNTAEVEALAVDGGRSSVTLTIERRVTLGDVFAMAIDRDAREVYALTSRGDLPRSLLRISLTDGVRVPLLQGDDAEARFDSSVRDIAWDADARRLVVLRQRNLVYVPIDEDGTVGEVVNFSPDVPGSLRITNGNTMVFDAARRQVVVHDLGSSAIVAVNLATGARTLVSSSAQPGPAMLDHDLRLALDSDRLIVTGFRPRAISAVYTIDLNTGARAILSDNTGLDSRDPLYLDRPRSPAVTSDGATAFVFDRADVLTVDLSTGTRRLVDVDDVFVEFDAFVVDGSVLAFDTSNQRLVAFEVEPPSLRAVSENRFPRDLPNIGQIDGESLTLLGDTFYAGEVGARRNLIAVQRGSARTIVEADDANWLLAPQASRGRLVAFEDDAEGGLLIVDGASDEVTRFAVSNDVRPEVLLATPGADVAYGYNEDSYWRFDLRTGANERLLLEGLPVDGAVVAVAANDTTLFLLHSSFRDDLATVYAWMDGTLMEVSGRDDEGPPLEDARGAAWTEEGLLVLTNDGLVRVDASGGRSFVADRGTPVLNALVSDGRHAYARALDDAQLYRLQPGGVRLGVFDRGRGDL
ncbi:MAG: hypothetical protein AAGE52_30125 [Myxococcota bacterium]